MMSAKSNALDKGLSYEKLSKMCRDPDEFMQVNYIKNSIYQVKADDPCPVPLSKEEDSLIDYLADVKSDHEKILEPNQQIKSKLFKVKHPRFRSKHRNYSVFNATDYIERISPQRKSQLNFHGAEPAESVKFIDTSQFSVGFPKPQKLGCLLTSANTTQVRSKAKSMVTEKQSINQSLNELLQKSHKYQNKEVKKSNIRTRIQLQKDNKKVLSQERNDIMKVIASDSQLNRKNNPKKVNQLSDVPNREKYNLDFMSYLRTKTKSALENYIYQKRVRKPELDVEKFQEFILNEVHLTVEHKHEIERFFMRMRTEFRRANRSGSQCKSNQQQNAVDALSSILVKNILNNKS